MQFKIKNISVKISFSFFALILLFAVYGNLDTYAVTLICALLHETVHILFIYLCSGGIKEIEFSLFGGKIERKNGDFCGYIKEALINASAPVFNIMCGFVFYKYKLFSTVNFALGIFNLMPFYCFDGGRVVENILFSMIDERKTSKILTVLSILTASAFSFVAVYIFANYQKNYMLLVFSVYCVTSIILKK